MIDFDEEEVAKKVLEHMKENNFIKKIMIK